CLPPLGRGDAPVDPTSPDATNSAACASCHGDIHEIWSTSTHALAERELDEASQAALTGGRLDVRTAEGPEAVEPVRVIGVDPLWQYLVPASDGRLQVTQVAWDPERREHFDVFGDDRASGEWGHWTGGAMTWNVQCASCHDTGVDKGLTVDVEGGASYSTSYDELGVGCAACHGDPGSHATGGPPPVVETERWLDVCASCHARRAELTGRFEPGNPFLDHFRPELVDTSDAFFADGQVREEDFEYTAFIGSTMHQRGVTCTSCHDPHSGQLKRQGDSLCLGCHEAMDFEAHDPHAESVGCAGCHMPVTTYMQRDPRHDHGFIVPDPGIEGVPDVCTRCHEERSTAWAVAVADQWWPDRRTERRERAVRMLGARRGDPAVIEGLQTQLTQAAPAWRASAATALGAFADRDAVVATLIGASGDEVGLVRMAAVEALGPVAGRPDVEGALRPRLSDDVAAVRVAAARGLRHRLGDDAPAARDYRRYLEHNADQPAALLDAAGWDLALGRPERAVSKLERAISLDPGSPVLYDQLATAYARSGANDKAVWALERALAAGADDAESWYRLGLARHGAGDVVGAQTALERATARDPAHPRAAYNLGVLLTEMREIEAAVHVLAEATRHRPDDPELLYSLAFAQWEGGRQEQARRTAERVLMLAPHHRGATQLLGSTITR
ncbi:MAG: tetratricopeptide repeat protein, partial [Myxococcota bacterium]